MVAAVIGVVQQVDVARLDFAAEELRHCARGPGQRADVDGHVFRLRDEAAVEIADGRGKVAAGIEDLRIRGAQHRLAHFLDDGVQPMLHDGHGDAINHAHHPNPHQPMMLAACRQFHPRAQPGFRR